MKGGPFEKKNNKPHYDKPQSRQSRPVNMPSRAGQHGAGGKGRRSIPRSK